MGSPDRRKRSRSGRVLDGLIWGAAVGAASGAALGDGIDGVGAGAGALLGGALYALLPCNAGEHDLVLTSRTELPYPGHYLSSVDSERDALTVLKLLYFQERIFVYVADGELKTDHSFSLAGQRFLTLHYEIERLGAASA
jgi:hypothetical protein